VADLQTNEVIEGHGITIMKFDFFKEKGDGRKRDHDLFDPNEDGLGFDELEASGEFLSGENYAPPPAPPPVPRGNRPLPPTPRPSAPLQNSPLPRAPLPRTPLSGAPPASSPQTASPRPPAPAYDDLTVVNLPADIARPGGVQPSPPVSPVPPGPPRRSPLAAGPATSHGAGAYPPSPSRAPYVPDGDVTQVLNRPVGVESVVAWLVVATGPQRGLDFRLPGGLARIGIDARCDICLHGDTYVSSRHADISFMEGQYHIRDLDSTNGTFVNEVRVAEAFLGDNDRLRLGQTTFIFKSLNL
jgi:hypothetical protein